ncbi:Myosin light chain 2 [Nakaseomyces bracarensis]|uniref:Myosin light chain 2 n=1 Tax=Nakaseomyces bracarensis TaxID=273131 RepID=A0ABR4NZN0_9SACH
METSKSLEFDQLTQKQVGKLRDAFQLIDDDGDGKISSGDMAKMLASLGKRVEEKDVGGLFPQLKEEGSVTFPEFLALMSERICEFPQEEELQECFKIISDGDKDLNIPTERMLQLLEEAGFQDPKEEFKKILAAYSNKQQMDGAQIFKAQQFIDSLNE